MREFVEEMVRQVATGHEGSFAHLASVAEPERFVQWVRYDDEVRFEVTAQPDPGDLAALGLRPDVPGWSGQIAPDALVDVVVRALELLELRDPAAIETNVEVVTTAWTPEVDDGDNDEPEPLPADRFLLVFERPDGRARYAVSRDPEDYLERLASGEWATKNLPADAVFRGRVPLADAGAVIVKEPLNQDRLLGDAVLAAVRDGVPGAVDEGWRAEVLALVTAGEPITDEATRGPLGAWGAERDAARAAKPAPKPRKPAAPKVRAGSAEIQSTPLPAWANAAARGAGCGWAWLSGGELARLGDDGTVTTESLPHDEKPLRILAAPSVEAVVGLGMSSAWLRAPDGSAHPLPGAHEAAVCAAGVLLARGDGRVALFGWDGAERWTTADRLSEHRCVPVVAGEQAFVVAQELLWPVDLADGTVRRALQPPRRGAWDTAEVSSAAPRGDVILVSTGSALAALGPDGRWSDAVDLDERYAHLEVTDSAGGLVGFSDGRGALVVPHDDARIRVILATDRRLSGRRSDHAVLTADHVLVRGRVGNRPPNGVDVFDLSDGSVLCTIDTARVEVSGAWPVEDGFVLVAGTALHRVRMG